MYSQKGKLSKVESIFEELPYLDGVSKIFRLIETWLLAGTKGGELVTIQRV